MLILASSTRWRQIFVDIEGLEVNWFLLTQFYKETIYVCQFPQQGLNLPGSTPIKNSNLNSNMYQCVLICFNMFQGKCWNLLNSNIKWLVVGEGKFDTICHQIDPLLIKPKYLHAWRFVTTYTSVQTSSTASILTLRVISTNSANKNDMYRIEKIIHFNILQLFFSFFFCFTCHNLYLEQSIGCMAMGTQWK